MYEFVSRGRVKVRADHASIRSQTQINVAETISVALHLASKFLDIGKRRSHVGINTSGACFCLCASHAVQMWIDG